MKLLLKVIIVLGVLSLVACSDEPQKYDFKGGVMGENVVGTTPQESVEALKNGEKPSPNTDEAELDPNAKPTRTPTEGLSPTDTKVVQTVDYFYQHLMNNEFDQIDALVVSAKRNKNSYGDYYKKKLLDNEILLLDFKVDRISDKEPDEKFDEKYFIIEVDVEQVVGGEVITYRDYVTLTKEGSNWFIDSIETEVK